MKRLLALTLILTVALVGYALATDEPNNTTATQSVSVAVDGVFWLGWQDTPADNIGEPVDFFLEEADLFPAGNGPKYATYTDVLSARSNYDDVDLTVNWGGWSAAGFGGTLAISYNGGATYNVFPGSYSIVSSPNDYVDGDWDIHYKLDGYGPTDEPGTYTTTVTFTLTL